MKSPIPENLRGRTISNIIVVGAGILMAATLMHFGRLLSIFQSIMRKAMPLFIGFAIAFILLPSVKRMELFFARITLRYESHRRLFRILSIVIVYLLMLSLLAGFFAILVPQVIKSLKSVVSIISGAIPRSTHDFQDMVENSTLLQQLGIDTEQIMKMWSEVTTQISSRLRELSTYTSGLLDYVLAIASSISTGVYSVLFHALVGLIASIYMLLDRERFSAQIKKICYATMKQSTCETLIHWTRKAHRIFAGFITGKILDSLIIGVVCYVCMLIFRIEYPLLISVIVGVTNIIPFFGPYIGAIPSILFLLLVNPLSALWFGIFIIILQQLDGNVIGPMILGDHVGLSAFWIMLAITIGGGLFGFPGMLLSVPAFALLYAIARTVIDKRLRVRGLPQTTASYVAAPEKLIEEAAEPADTPKASPGKAVGMLTRRKNR